MGVTGQLELVGSDIEELQQLYKKCKAILDDKTASEQSRKSFDAICTKIRNSASSLIGITRGHLKEVRLALKHQSKQRVVILQRYADVTIGNPDDVFAKSIQTKFCGTDKPTDVSTQLAEAAYQISGGNRETPRTKDRRVIDVDIWSATNPWPFTPKGKREGSLSELLAKAETEILHYVNEGKADKERGLTASGIKWISEISDYKPELKNKVTTSFSTQAGERSTLIRLTSTAGESVYKFNYVTVKIRFRGRTLTTEAEGDSEGESDEDQRDELNTAVFAIVKVDDELRCEHIAYDLKAGGKRFFHLRAIEL